MRLRLRLRVTDARPPRRGLYLTDTPRPGCGDCQGRGGWTAYLADGPSGEDGCAEDIPCRCWEPSRRRPLLLLPRPPRRILRRRTRGPAEPPEPPF